MTESEAVDAELAPEGRRAARGFASLTSSRGVTLLLQFVSFALLADHLGPVGLGVYAFAVSFASLFRLVPNFGFQPVVVRDIAQAPDLERTLVPNTAYLRLLLGALAYGALVATLFLAGYSPGERRSAMVAGAVLVLLAVDTFRSVLEVRLRMTPVAIADIVEAVVLLVAVVALVAADAAIVSFVAAFVVANLLNGLIVLVAALRVTSFDWRPRAALWWPTLRAAAPIGLSGLFAMIYFRIDIVLLARMGSDDDVGQYGAAYRFIEAALIVSPLLMAVLMPILARSFSASIDVLRRRFDVVVHLVLLLVLPMAVAGAITGSRVFPALPGFEEFEEGGRCLAILAPALAMMVLGTVLQGVLIIAHRQRWLFGISVAGAGLNVGLNLVLIPLWGAPGAALATTLTELAIVVLSAREVARRVSVLWPTATMVRATRATVLMTVVLLATSVIHPFAQLALGLLTYLLVLLPSGSLRWSDLASILRNDDGRRVAAPTGGSPVAAWRSLRGASVCEVADADGVPWWSPLVARAAGCGSVTVSGGRPNRRLRRALWPLFLDPVTDGRR